MQAEVAFIDEVFKANSAILNTLLTILNERLFDNGKERLPVPLLCLVAASNELPESEELDALYDRFLLRSQVQQVRFLAVFASNCVSRMMLPAISSDWTTPFLYAQHVLHCAQQSVNCSENQPTP